MYDDPLAYLEADLGGADLPKATVCRPSDPAYLLKHVAELANNEWSEAEAAAEIAARACVDCLVVAYAEVVNALCRNPFVDIPGIRIARILLAALDL